jgi:hypothetical protein
MNDNEKYDHGDDPATRKPLRLGKTKLEEVTLDEADMSVRPGWLL